MPNTIAAHNGETAAEKADGARYDFDIDVDTQSTHAKVVRLVGRHKRVLELGCATGYMSRVLRDHGCQVVGVELDAAMAARAEAYCDRLIVGDLDRLDLAEGLGDDRFDVIVAADILEHLKDPWAVLRSLRPYLRPGGYLVASLPPYSPLPSVAFPEWGNILAVGTCEGLPISTVGTNYWWMLFFPLLAILALGIGISLVCDGIDRRMSSRHA